LRAIAGTGDASNRYYAWALDHRDPHFAGRRDAAQLYRAFCKLFDGEVDARTPEALVEACLQPGRLSIA
jgi:hypothetical protein